jgi:hypothetical protein
VSGRIKHFISAFGEHVIADEVEKAILSASASMGIQLIEFTVAPFVSSNEGKSYHEWFIEFENTPENLEQFASLIDTQMRQLNVYYDDLISGNILSPLKIAVVQKNGFVDYMKSMGKLGGQNKVPRLSNDRKIAADLEKWVIR